MVVGAGGICYMAGDNSRTMRRCYNSGTIENGKNCGSIVGYLDSNGGVSDCYWTSSLEGSSNSPEWLDLTKFKKVNEDELKTYATVSEGETSSILGDAFVEDIHNINNGLPILAWQLNR